MKTAGQASHQGSRKTRAKTAGRSGGSTPVHDKVYQTMRQRLLTGGFLPGRPVTLRGIAQQLDVSVMPVREAVRRLIAERALEMQDNRRVCVPEMTRAKLDELLFARSTLETELAVRALPNLNPAALARIDAIDAEMVAAGLRGDIESYMRGNTDFHFAIYQCAKAEMLLGLIESVWLQLAPSMRLAYGRSGTGDLQNLHLAIRQALRFGDRHALVDALHADIINGMRITGELALSTPAGVTQTAGGGMKEPRTAQTASQGRPRSDDKKG